MRDLTPATAQDKANCDVCGEKKLCSDTVTLPSPEFAFTEKGFFNTTDLSKLLAMIKSRKAVILPRISHLQTALSRPVEELAQYTSLDVIEVLASEGLTKRTLDTSKQHYSKILAAVKAGTLSVPERATKNVILRNLLAELSGLNEKEKQMNILYKNAIDTILIQQLKHRMTSEQFKSAFEDAKIVYQKLNGNGVQKRRPQEQKKGG